MNSLQMSLETFYFPCTYFCLFDTTVKIFQGFFVSDDFVLTHKTQYYQEQYQTIEEILPLSSTTSSTSSSLFFDTILLVDFAD